jgi:hypothetical protein
MMVARTGPTSLMRAKKSRKASAVQTTPRVSTASSTRPDGMALGSCDIPTGA